MKTLIIISVLSMLGFGIFKGVKTINVETSNVTNWNASVSNFNYVNQESQIVTQQQNLKDILQPSLGIVSIVLIPFIVLIGLIWGLLSWKSTQKIKGDFSKTSLILLVTLFSFQVIAQDKIPIEKAADLPQHTYNLEVAKAMKYLKKDKLRFDLAQMVETQLLADLEKYDIQDKKALKGYYWDLYACAMTKKEYKKAQEYINKRIDLAEKPAEKYSSFIMQKAFAITTTEYKVEDEVNFNKALEANLIDLLSKAPKDKIQESLEGHLGFLELVGKNVILGLVKGELQPEIDKSKPQIPHGSVTDILGFKNTIDFVLPYQGMYHATIKNFYDKNYEAVELVDIWTTREITFSNTEKLNPIVVSVWDSGVDTDVFPKENIWTNPKEKIDGKDTDGNGFIDDVHGIAFNLEDEITTGLLLPIEQEGANYEQLVVYSKGLSDIYSAVKSEEATEFKKVVKALKPWKTKRFIEEISLFGNYIHGTHVAGIMMNNNPSAQLLTTRITFNHKIQPEIPTIENAKVNAELYEKTIQYFKDNNVRVVNMSWSGSQGGIESALAKNGVGKSDEERKAMAKEIFEIKRNAFYESMKNAPEILFVCAAGNSNSDVGFSNNLPSGLGLPNLLVVGAVDIEGKVTSFTTMGKGVHVYANGYEVESFIPGGTIQKSSGTSMASPQVANLAAKLWSRYPKLSVEEVKNAIINGATPSDENEAVLLIYPQKSLDLID